MSEISASHYWIRGGLRADRAAVVSTLNLPPALLPALPEVDAHQRLRGPYTAAGTIVRALVPDALPDAADLVRQHDIELLSAAPELGAIVPNSRETLTSMAIPAERTRFYARLRTVRISHGLVEFVRDRVPAGTRRSLVIENLDAAEATDLEFVAALLRRVDPARLTVVVCGGPTPPADDALVAVLAEYARTIDVQPTAATTAAAAPAGDGASQGTDLDAARAFVASDGTSDDPALHAAYWALDAAERAVLHDRRAAELTARDEMTLRLGAIPYHLEHGSDPAGAGLDALYAAEDHCLVLGFYQAAVDYGRRGMALIDERAQPERWWVFAIEVGLALSILSRTHEAMDIYDQARLLSTNPAVHMGAAYSTAMLYTRHNEPAERDEKKAKSWLHIAIAMASMVADRSERAFQSAFYKNGLALVEVNLGEPREALRLVDECVAALDEQLKPDEHRLHRSVLKNNRARVYNMLGRLDDALADYAIVIREDPNHAEHYLERGNILRRLGRPDEALADYARALRLSPPFPEIYYNRGDLRLSEGDIDGALADLDYVLELDPDFVDAYVNRAGIHLDAGDLDVAERDAAAGLRRDPDNAYLHVVAGSVHAERGATTAARAAFDRAIAADPSLVSALAARAALACDTGDTQTALADLARAVELDPDDAALRFNLAVAYQSAGRHEEALTELRAADALLPDDPDIQAALRACRREPAVP
jgi:tetratricopeptide (TPR) repeat protein